MNNYFAEPNNTFSESQVTFSQMSSSIVPNGSSDKRFRSQFCDRPEVIAVKAFLEGTELLVAHTVEGRSSGVRPLDPLLAMALVIDTLAHKCEKSSESEEHLASERTLARFASVPVAR